MKQLYFTFILAALLMQTAFAKTYVLVHGAMIDGTAWYKVIKPLQKGGNRVVVVNLPAHGKDNTNISAVTYESYIRAIADSINGQNEKVILVGHSMAGLLISSVAEQMPEKIEQLVFVAAFIPHDSDNVFGLNGRDTASKFGQSLTIANDKSYAMLKPEKIQAVFCEECAEADISLLQLSSKAEPLAPLAHRVKLTNVRYGSIPKYIIQTVADKAITYGFQREMAAQATNVFKIVTIKSGHLPFISRPRQFAKMLLSL